MEKISKVVPTSAKNKIDMSKERPMRSGAPNYGAPIAHSAVTLRKMEEAERVAKAAQLAEQRKLEMSPQELKHSEIVDKVTLNFNKAHPILIQVGTVDSTLSQNPSIEEISGDNEINQEIIESDPGSQIGPDRLSLYA